MVFSIPPDIYYPGLIAISASAVAFVSLLYAMRHWKRGGYIRLIRAVVCLVLAGLALSDVFDGIIRSDLTYMYFACLVILLALSFITALVEL